MFGELLAKAKKKVDEAGKALEDANHRNDVIQKHLRNVEILNLPENTDILQTDD